MILDALSEAVAGIAGLPEWVMYKADKAATETLFRELADFEPVIKLAGRYYLGAKGTCP